MNEEKKIELTQHQKDYVELHSVEIADLAVKLATRMVDIASVQASAILIEIADLAKKRAGGE